MNEASLDGRRDQLLIPLPGERGILLRLGALALLVALIVLLWRWDSPLLLRLLLAAALCCGGFVLVQQLQRLWTTQRAYQLAMQAAHDGFWEWDPVSKRLTVGARLLEILGYSRNFLPDTHAWLELVHPDDRAHYNRSVSEHLKGLTPYFYCEYRVRTQAGDYCWIASRGIAVRDSRGIAYQMAGSVTDITERKRHEEQISFLAQHDQLTGLPNRFVLAEKLGEALATAAGGQRVGLLFIDLDRFKDINDSLGHSLGDHLLQAVAARLRERLGTGETLVRQGGDEFIVILPDCGDDEHVGAIAARFLEVLERPIEADGNQLHVGASLGLSIYPDDASDAGQLLRHADTAMYVAKRQGGGRVCRHTPEMRERVLHRASIESRLRQAVEHRAFELHFQPQLDTRNGLLLGAEALLRWRDGERWIPPGQFIPVAEETELIVAIGDWVLDTAIACLSRWHLPPDRAFRMAINLSPRQFWQGNLGARIRAVVAQHGVAPRSVELEITESMLLQAEGDHVDLLHALREQGFRLALDDFGTGYSALSYLHRLPFTSLKIDQSFVASLVDSSGHPLTGSALVPAIIAMAHRLGLEVVAEGVETEAQLAILRDLDCDIHQGYLRGRPVSEADFVRLYLDPGRAAQSADDSVA